MNMMYNNAPAANPMVGGFGYPSTVINPVNEKPAVSTLNQQEEKILAKTGGNDYVFTPEEIAVAHCNHAPGSNGQNVLSVESDDGTIAKFYCTRCHTHFEVDRRLTEADVSKVCEVMHNVINMVKTYLGGEVPPDYARDVYAFQAALPKLPKLFGQAKKSIERQVAALQQQYQQSIPGAFYGGVNPYQTAYANGLTSPQAMNMYTQYAQAVAPTFNGNGIPQQMYAYGGQPMMGAPVQQQPYGFPQAGYAQTPYAPSAFGGVAPMPTGGMMTADMSNPLVAGAPAQPVNAGFSVPAPAGGGLGLSFNAAAAPAATPQMTAAPAAAPTAATPAMSVPMAGAAIAPPIAPTAAPAAPTAPEAAPAGNTASVTL